MISKTQKLNITIPPKNKLTLIYFPNIRKHLQRSKEVPKNSLESIESIDASEH